MQNKKNISPSRQKLIVYIVLTVVTLAVFWQVNQYDFINLDDNLYVTENSHIQSGITLDGFLWAFSTRYASLWNPLVWLSFMFDYQFYGLNAGGYHLTNLILHIMSALLLFWLFNRMTGAIWKSAFVAALFALHPLHVESVAWISERKDVLSALFWMLTLCLYVYYTEKPAIKRYLLVLFSFVLALMSKPMVITLPMIMILLDYWPLDRLQSRKIPTNTDVMPVYTNKGKKKNKSKKETLKKNISPQNDQKLLEPKIAGIIPLWQLREKIPFFVLSAVLAIITLYTPNTSNMPEALELKQFPLGSRLANAPVAFVTYLEKSFWPHDMAIFYPFTEHLPLWQILGATLLILVFTTFVIVMVKRLPYLFVGWMWFAITITPVIGIIQISLTAPYAMADRYHYLPSIGIAIMLAWGIPSLIKSENIRKKLLFPVIIVLLIIMSVLTWQQCAYWKNSIELWNHAFQVTKDNYLAHHSRGNAYGDLGQHQRAIEDYNEAIRLKPDSALFYNNRGTIYDDLGQHQRAIKDYNEAIRLKPDYTDAYYNRGTIYGRDLGQYQRAIEDFNEAIRLKPDHAMFYSNRGTAYFMQGNSKAGCFDAQKACELGVCNTLEWAKSKGYCR